MFLAQCDLRRCGPVKIFSGAGVRTNNKFSWSKKPQFLHVSPATNLIANATDLRNCRVVERFNRESLEDWIEFYNEFNLVPNAH